MDIQPIKSERDYRRTLREIEGVMSARRDTPQGDRLDALVTLVEAWESGQECSRDERSDILGGRR
jgi:HTH-type transcriptional regulator/antitoxin HigA